MKISQSKTIQNEDLMQNENFTIKHNPKWGFNMQNEDLTIKNHAKLGFNHQKPCRMRI